MEITSHNIIFIWVLISYRDYLSLRGVVKKKRINNY